MARKKAILDVNGQPFEQPFAGYLINARIEGCRHGLLWRASDGRFGREVVIREMRLPSDRREEAIEEFFTEASAVARVKHKHIVRALDCGRAGERFHVVCDFVFGEPLSRMIAEGRALPEEKAAVLALQALDALDYLHEQGMSHNDISPANLMIDQEGNLRIADIGMAKSLLYQSRESWFAANANYAAPECISGAGHGNMRSDLFSLGCSLYQAVSGKLPFPSGTDKTSEEAPALRSINPLIGAVFSSFIAALTMLEADSRPSTPNQARRKLANHSAVAAILQAQEEKDAALAAKPEELEEGEEQGTEE